MTLMLPSQTDLIQLLLGQSKAPYLPTTEPVTLLDHEWLWEYYEVLSKCKHLGQLASWILVSTALCLSLLPLHIIKALAKFCTRSGHAAQIDAAWQQTSARSSRRSAGQGFGAHRQSACRNQRDTKSRDTRTA